jgi:hypothetical protein
MNMKKMFAALALGAALILSFSASAMPPLTDSDLSVVIGSGQEDVNRNLNADGIGTTATLLKNMDDLSQHNVKRRSGVSINMDVSMNLYFGVIAWGDMDGLGTTAASGAGSVGLSQTGLQIRQRN